MLSLDLLLFLESDLAVAIIGSSRRLPESMASD
jgi:hypothetical protein